MEPVIEAPLAGRPYAARLDALLAAGVGLWDVIATARRKGSLDTAIRDAAVRPLAAFAATLPSLRALAFNGGKAFAIGARQLGSGGPHALVALPSSSAAYCAIPFAAKQARWMQLRAFLDA